MKHAVSVKTKELEILGELRSSWNIPSNRSTINDEGGALHIGDKLPQGFNGPIEESASAYLRDGQLIYRVSGQL